MKKLTKFFLILITIFVTLNENVYAQNTEQVCVVQTQDTTFTRAEFTSMKKTESFDVIFLPLVSATFSTQKRIKVTKVINLLITQDLLKKNIKFNNENINVIAAQVLAINKNNPNCLKDGNFYYFPFSSGNKNFNLVLYNDGYDWRVSVKKTFNGIDTFSDRSYLMVSSN